MSKLKNVSSYMRRLVFYSNTNDYMGYNSAGKQVSVPYDVFQRRKKQIQDEEHTTASAAHAQCTHPDNWTSELGATIV